MTIGRTEHRRCNDLRRWKLETRWFSVRLHHWEQGDPPHLQHRHPWDFVTVVLKGGYDDVGVGRPVDRLRAPAIRYRGKDWRHSVSNVLPGTWSVVITGPKVRNWRFWIGKREVARDEWNGRICEETA